MPEPRYFNNIQRLALWLASGGKCQKCGIPLDEKWEADHIQPYSVGGKTDVLNGQALCQKCNREKGAKSMDVKLRSWQVEQQNDFDYHDHDWFTLIATPGAGKTVAMLNNANSMIRKNKADFIVGVVPSETLKYQWKEKALTLFNLKFKSDFDGFVTPEYDGVMVTYQQLAGNLGREQIRALHSYRGRIFVIFDEPHHMADSRTWGSSAKYAFEKAVGGVLGTGTPFRSDDYPIPFVRYNPQTYELVPDYEYLYQHGLIDQVVRAIFFRKIDTKASWYSYTDEVLTDVSFYDSLNERQQQERLNAVLNPKGDFVKDVLRQAYAETTRLREVEQPNAKGLVICKDTRHASAIADVFEEVNGIRPMVVSSDDEHGNKKDIENFKASDDPYIISVDMISEGVDIPPLRSLVYLTNKTAPLYFYQAIGRVVRVERGYELCNGYVYLPSDPRLLRLAETIKQRRNHVAKYLADIQADASGVDGNAEAPIAIAPRGLEVISAQAIDDGGIYDAEGYSSEELAQANAFIKQHGMRVSVEECARFLRLLSHGQSTPSERQQSEDPEMIQKELRNHANKLAYQLGLNLGCDPKEIHSEWVYNEGGNWQAQAPIEELKRKIVWLNKRLNRRS